MNEEDLDTTLPKLGQRDLQQRFDGTVQEAVAAARSDIKDTIRTLPRLGEGSHAFRRRSDSKTYSHRFSILVTLPAQVCETCFPQLRRGRRVQRLR